MILYHGEPFSAQISDSDLPAKCVPIVYSDGLSMGPGYTCPDTGQSSWWGLAAPIDIITAWRATEILRHVRSIGSSTLCDSYYAALRKPHSSDRERVQRIINEIGTTNHRRIMQMAVPNEIVQAVLDGQSTDMKPALWPITGEVRAGTIRWRVEFELAGVKKPKDVDQADRRAKKIVRSFFFQLFSWSLYRSLPRKCVGMNYVEGALITLVDKGMTGPKPLVVALAGMVGELATSEFALFIIPVQVYKSQEEARRAQEEKRLKAAEQAARWLHERWRWPFSKPAKTREELRDELLSLCDKYLPQKSRQVPEG